jgi:hypothetical protein
MFERSHIVRAVDLQQRSYKLLVWMGDAIERGFIRFSAAHSFATLPAATRSWIDSHYNDLPVATRPPRDDLDAFCELFATYLESSFDLLEDPGQRRYSPDAHCFCPLCSWMVAMPHLRTKKLSDADKERARKLTTSALRQLALELELELADEHADQLTDEPTMREPLALVAYGHDLLRRMKGVVEGPASLALWRRFAWTPQGSPKHGYQLTAELVLDAETAVIERLRVTRR